MFELQNTYFWFFFLTFGVFVITFFCLKSIQKKNDFIKRINNIKKNKVGRGIASLATATLQEDQRELFSKKMKLSDNIISQYIKRLSQENVLFYKTLFERAGWSSSNASLISMFVKVQLLLIFGILNWFLLQEILFLEKQNLIIKLLLLLMAMLLGFRSFDYFLAYLIGKRQLKIKRGLSNALGLLALCAKAGLNIDRSFEYTAKEIAEFNRDLCREFALTFLELNMLPVREIAYENLARRVSIPLIQALATTLKQAEEHGTSIAQTLTILSDEFNKQRIVEAEVKAAKLATFLTVPVIIFTLPSLMIILLAPSIIKLIEQFS
jgi:tight adherence protein C